MEPSTFVESLLSSPSQFKEGRHGGRMTIVKGGSPCGGVYSASVCVCVCVCVNTRRTGGPDNSEFQMTPKIIAEL